MSNTQPTGNTAAQTAVQLAERGFYAEAASFDPSWSAIADAYARGDYDTVRRAMADHYARAFAAAVS